MAKRKGLPKKYAKMGFKKGWAAYKRTKRTPARRTYTTPIRRRRTRPMAKKRTYRRKTTNILTSKNAIDGYIAEGGKFIVRKVIGGGPLYEAGVDAAVGLFRHNNTLTAQAIVKGITAFLPNFNLGGGITGGGVR